MSELSNLIWDYQILKIGLKGLNVDLVQSNLIDFISSENGKQTFYFKRFVRIRKNKITQRNLKYLVQMTIRIMAMKQEQSGF